MRKSAHERATVTFPQTADRQHGVRNPAIIVFIYYIFHPVEAAMIATMLTDDKEVIAAAALHDVAEDTDYTLDEIRAVFGEKIASLVASESKDKRKEISAKQSWFIRKEEALDHLTRASREAKLICIADKLSNIRDIKADYDELNDELWTRFQSAQPRITRMILRNHS